MSNTVNITKRFVDSKGAEPKDQTYWDSAIRGFGLKVTPKGRKVYLFKYRNMAKTQRKATLGVHGNITCEQARKIAQQWSHEVSQGNDPAGRKQMIGESPTIAELCDRYLNQYAKHYKKESSVEFDRIQIEKRIKPSIGNLKIATINQNDITRLHHQMRETPTQANRVLAVLSKMFNLAEKWGLRPDMTNPVRNIDKYPEKARERFLSQKEAQRLLAVLDEEEEMGIESIYVISLIRLLIFTGARLREIMHAKWEWLDMKKGFLHLPDSKTGKKTIQLSAPAISILKKLPKQEKNPYIICGKVEGMPLNNARKPWLRIRQKAELEDVRLHDLRHSFAALAIEAGIPLYHVGKLLGHKQSRTTERYAHLADDPIKAAAELVGKQLDSLNG